MKLHLEEECDYRKIICDKCKKNILFKDKKSHEDECELVEKNKNIFCKKCGAKVDAEQMENIKTKNVLNLKLIAIFYYLGVKINFLGKININIFLKMIKLFYIIKL